ncbi:hypothetical protein FA13DRAFT_1731196 [Coprinellus micaceus]|uniref:Uncharacterized protein n=1 Tax=Coprinellus micaceus TaxID=71717 RepID=A0A4Y7TEY0_COPMI|nr:hypothetical protein FA13DRAFT_1731196 [Coprinellus micaceus]
MEQPQMYTPSSPPVNLARCRHLGHYMLFWGSRTSSPPPHPRTKPAPRLEESTGRRALTDNGGPSVPEWLEFSRIW